jgi:uncharacterized C2H2 Zn-finger protein
MLVVVLTVSFILFLADFATYEGASYHSDFGLESLQCRWLQPHEQVNVTTPRNRQPHNSCPNCGKIYTWKKNLVRHLKLECDKKPQQKCPYCHFITKHKSVVKTHIYRKHKSMPNIL